MFKRILLAMTFVAALGVAGLGISKPANAWGCHHGYGGGYGGYGGYSSYYAPYGYSSYYGPRYRAYRGGYYPAYYRGYNRGGVYFSVGF